MVMRKKLIITISVILAVIVVAVCVTVPTLYMYGMLADIHKFTNPEEGQIRVACVGDSLTYGHGVENWPKNNYPTQLGNMLGDEYCVNNYGYSGRTASKSCNRSYTSEKLYKQSLEFAPDIVIIMLGSNDTKSDVWKGKDSYVADYTEIIESYLALESVKSVYIMSPTPVWMKHGRAPYGINIELVATVIHDVAKELSIQLGLNYIDLYEVFADKGNMFSDGAHPNAEGASLIAKTVYEKMQSVKNLEVFDEDGTMCHPFL